MQRSTASPVPGSQSSVNESEEEYYKQKNQDHNGDTYRNTCNCYYSPQFLVLRQFVNISMIIIVSTILEDKEI